MKTNVAILCPVAESVPPVAFQSIVAMASYSSARNIRINHIGVTERTLVDTARNILASEFLKTDNEWAMWLDCDMVFPKETMIQLLETAKRKKSKLVTGVYYQRGGKHYPVLWTRNPELESGIKMKYQNEEMFNQNEYMGTYLLPAPEAKKPLLADTAGFGCVLMHRNVLEVMDRPYFQFLPGKCSEDFYFFAVAKQRGFQLWADPRMDLKHIGSPEIIGRENCHQYLEENKIEVEAIK